MKQVGWLVIVGATSIAGAAAGCGIPFTVGSDTSAGGGTASGTTGKGGGAATCTPGDPSGCAAGEFCKSSDACAACSASPPTTFGTPKPVGITVPSGDPIVLVPRIAQGSDLFFASTTALGATLRIGSAHFDAATMSWQPGVSAPPQIAGPQGAATGEDSSPLPLADGGIFAGLLGAAGVDTGEPVLVFNSNRPLPGNPGSGRRRIYLANQPSGANDIYATLLSDTVNSDGINSGMAAAPAASPPRLWWMSDRFTSAQQRLVTYAAGQSVADARPMFDPSCEVSGELYPWVTPDGKFLLFSAQNPGASCNAGASAPVRMYLSRLDGTGKQVSGVAPTAITLDDPATDNDVSPSLSADQCTLYFARIDFGATTTGTLYQASKK